MADIQLSSQLFQDIQQAVAKAHPGADTGIVLQYLAAVSGYMLGSERSMQDEEKQAFFAELCGFAEHVYNDLQKRQQPQQRQVDPGQAFGYWNPPKK